MTTYAAVDFDRLPVRRRGIFHRMVRHPLAACGAVILSLIVLITLLGPLLVPNDPLAVNMADRLQPPSREFPLGTDHMGRCLFSRLVEGARTTLGISCLAIAAVVLLGIPVGLLAGTVGGRVDTAIMRFIDGVGVLPEFVLAIAISGFLGPSLANLILSIVLVGWIGYARVVRSIVLSEREKNYVLAARAAGCGTWTIMRRHLLPQTLSSVIVLAALDAGTFILIVSSFSYLGLGAQPPSPEWGAMLNDGRSFFQTAPQLMIYPGAAILSVVMACNLLGDGLRDILDVRGRKDAG